MTIAVTKKLADTFAVEGRDLYRLLCLSWRDVYRAELEADLEFEAADEVRGWLRDANPQEFALLLRIAYRDGVAK